MYLEGEQQTRFQGLFHLFSGDVDVVLFSHSGWAIQPGHPPSSSRAETSPQALIPSSPAGSPPAPLGQNGQSRSPPHPRPRLGSFTWGVSIWQCLLCPVRHAGSVSPAGPQRAGRLRSLQEARAQLRGGGSETPCSTRTPPGGGRAPFANENIGLNFHFFRVASSPQTRGLRGADFFIFPTPFKAVIPNRFFQCSWREISLCYERSGI